MSTSTEQLDREMRESWQRAAGAWQRWQSRLREETSSVTEWLVQAIDPRPGQRVLELAAGPGETGFVAAARLGPDGKLICSDQSQEMVGVARQRAQELGLDNVEFAQIDAQRLDLEPQSVDAVLCRWGYMLMADPDAALRATQRTLKSGGKLALATWDTPDRNLWMSAPVIQLVSRGLIELPQPGSPSPFAMPDPAALEQRLRDAGFADAGAEKLEFTYGYASFDEYWQMTLDLAAPLADAMAPLHEQTRDEIREGSRNVLAPATKENGALDVPASAIVASATA